MPKGALAQTKSVAPALSHARAPLDERTLRGETARGPARSIPSELAVLLGEIEVEVGGLLGLLGLLVHHARVGQRLGAGPGVAEPSAHRPHLRAGER